MERQSDHSRNRLFGLILANIIVLTLVVALCLDYVTRVNQRSLEATLSSFSSTVDTMGKTAVGYLKNQQEICNDWARYLNIHHPDMDAAIAFLQDGNSNGHIMAHIIDPETMIGRSATSNPTDDGEVDYSRLSSFSFAHPLADADNPDDFEISITDMYTNPVNALNVVGFGHWVDLSAENGALKRYILLRVIPVNMLLENWTFPSTFKDVELSLIQASGEYIIRSASLKNSNFWEYMRVYNDLSYAQRDALEEEMIASDDPYLLKNAVSEDAYFVCHPAEEARDWCFVGYMPGESVEQAPIDWLLISYVVLGFLLLFAGNSAYILSINRRLKQSVEQTRQANLAKTQFLSSMSHDIRTPMNAIIGMTTIASRHIDDPEQIKDCLGKITLASNHLLTLINDVLDISKVESGKMTLSPVVFSLSESVMNLANIVRPNIRAKALDFDIHIQNIFRENLFADELRLNQIFINILSNAVKYTPEGGRITMTVEEREIPDDPKLVELVYIVEDTGIGMSPEFQKKMYSTFSRAIDTRIDKIQGSGLGLAIVKQMVDLMDGTIDCQSALGEGTKFTIRLRMQSADAITDDLVLPPMEVLVVDDDEIFLQTAQDTLESLNLKVETVNNGADAIRLVQNRHELHKDYPVIIVDWKMPVMDGVETTRRIRESVGKDVSIIIISSYDWTEIEEAAREAGADAFINKPLFKSSVYYKLNELLSFEEKEAPDALADDGSFAGLRLLVAEDNDLNWEIIQELLEYYSIVADRASNGEICVDMLVRAEATRYDAVLMDIQMPVMNGLQAAQAIRRMNNTVKKNIPIVAMTANAFSDDIRECLDAGMNGHVPKPIDLPKLFAELRNAGVSPRSSGAK